jgi:hypothetical protein
MGVDGNLKNESLIHKACDPLFSSRLIYFLDECAVLNR